jgi:hypothetical protein
MNFARWMFTGGLACLVALPAATPAQESDVPTGASAPPGPDVTTVMPARPTAPAPAGPSPSESVWCVGPETRCPLPAGTPHGKKCWCAGTSG